MTIRVTEAQEWVETPNFQRFPPIHFLDRGIPL
jgi:hypothetical protein